MDEKIITGDETWVYQYDPETKRQSSKWIERGEPKPKKARFTKSKVKTLLVTFFYINGLVHHEFIPFGRTINQEVYLGIMRRLREAVRLKRPERWQNNDWILHADNARPHTAHVVLQFLAKHSTIYTDPYSPNLAPNDLFLYPKLKIKLKGRKFDNVDMIQAESKATLRNFSKSDFISCFDNWKKRWNRRRDDGQTLVVGTHEVDNRWVVPYNPYLLVRFNAHINVEVCASVKSVKYLFKYVYKGHDRPEVEVSVGELDMESRAHDEIKNFLDARYVSAPEAMWRMFEYRLHAHSHTICRLAVHLPNFQSVYFVEGSEEQALENASRRRTTLTAWFQLNCVNVSARSLLYGDIPSAYVFRQNQWSARVRGGALCIGRMCSVNPKDSERYHLRLLLLHVAGAQSFEDLRTVDDIVCSTFKEAAQRRGLLADDSEWDACLAEAALFQMPCQLRQLFATILIYNNPTDPVSLWTKYKGYLSEDFSRATSDAAAEQMTLRELEFQLRENRLSCHHYGLPAPLTPLLDSGEDHLDVNAELQIGTEMYRSLTPDQKSIVDTIVDSLNVNPRCFFIDGPGGTGKTYVYNTLIHCVRAVGKIVIPLASTGIAATLLSGGQTVHSRFKLPIPLLENSVAAISANSSEAELIRRSSLIIWDEAPMAHYRALEIVDRLLKDIMHCDLAFGGKVVVLGGDFRQVLPVVPRASRAEIVAACIKQSKLWPLFVILRLTQNMRAGIDAQSFSQWLLKVGDGDLPTDQQGLISLPESCIFHGVDLVQEIFGSSYGDISALSQSVILTPKNTDSLEINEKVLDRLPNRSQCFLSVDSVECENVEEQNNYPTEFLNSLTPTGMPPHRLNLKIGAIVMLLRNLHPKQGLCNGTRMVIQRMRSHVLEAQILTGTKVGQTVLVPKISLAPSDTNLPFILKRRQFPLRLAFAMTINKAQGQTFARVGLLLHEPVFTHGQLYVAFSRVRTLNSIRGYGGAASVLMLESETKASIFGMASNHRQSQTFTKVCLDHGAMINESCTPIPHSMRSWNS
ncbi:hypothetical protein LAZ67_21002595 [Cordylochernes scorpioides]|uniref:ATP-dependent DNA helicase n=1 Tax=Cordylochernes scorpioides TaxID=51811 RepID=A0ABY6LMW4_9ARAC|nr:hypothetical protein LAZ67_21002595 [Cordylochernes scorpioides]